MNNLLGFEKQAILFLLKHCLYGIAGGFTFGVALLYFDVGGLRSLAFQSDHTILVLLLLFFGLFVTFGSIGMGVGVMSQGRDEN